MSAEQPSKSRVLRAPLSTGLAREIQKRCGVVVTRAIQRGKRDYVFESSELDVVRAFWRALIDVHRHAPSGSGGHAIAKAAGTKITDLRPTIQAHWPEAGTER